MVRLQRIIGRSILPLLLLAPLTSHSASGKIVSQQLLSSESFERRIQLTVDGEPLSLLLNPSYVTDNATIYDRFGSPVNSSARHFTGQIEGEDSSWVRTSLYQSTMSGVISRHDQRYEVTTTPRGAITIEPLADNHRSIKKVTRRSSSALRGRRTVSATANTDRKATNITRVAKISIVVDSQYNEARNGQGLERALSIINAVDGIYREEFGLALRVVSVINVVDRTNDPFDYGAVPIETMLRNFRDYRMQSAELADASMVHLFTGNINSDEPVGLAWINTACRPDGYDVGISRPYQHDILLAAHEIAHNLGAHHDTETSCRTETDKVMWPYISSQTSQQFSSCTHSAVMQALENSCHIPATDLQLSLSTDTEDTISGAARYNNDKRATTATTLTFDWPAGDNATALDGECNRPEQRLKCTIGTLLPGDEALSDEFLNNQNPVKIALKNENAASVTKAGTGIFAPGSLILLALLIPAIRYRRSRL